MNLRTSLAEEWQDFEQCAGDSEDLKHAFYMGAWMALEHLHAFPKNKRQMAIELDEYMIEHANYCPTCAKFVLTEGWQTIEARLFGEQS
jgi:hypothetical protein